LVIHQIKQWSLKMVNTPDLNKAIDVALEEYKTLRVEIIQAIQNRTNVIIFGGALVATLIGIGVTSLANIPTTTKTIATTAKSSTQTINSGVTIMEETTKKNIAVPNRPKPTEKENKKIIRPPTTEIITPFGTENVTTTIQPMNEDKVIQGFHDSPMYRRFPSAIILGIVVPISCGCIIYFWFNATNMTLVIGRYIATNIEPKINLYFNDLPYLSKPLTWENYMQTINFGLEESWWVFGLFFVIGIGSSVATFLILGWEVYIIIQVILSLIVFYFYWCFWKQIKELQNIRDKEGSIRRIFYPGIGIKNSKIKQEIKPELIIWKSYLPCKTELNNPFYFQNGQTATNVLELLSFCVDPNYLDECIEHLKQKNFEKWLSYIKETELAKTTKNLSKNKNEDPALLSNFVDECYRTLYQGEAIACSFKHGEGAIIS
jgi:hypothetical protein